MAEDAVQDAPGPLVSAIWSCSSETGMDETCEGRESMKTQIAGFQALYGSCGVEGRRLNFGSDLPGLPVQGLLGN